MTRAEKRVHRGPVRFGSGRKSVGRHCPMCGKSTKAKSGRIGKHKDPYGRDCPGAS